MKRVTSFMDAMSNAFTLPLISEDVYKEALRAHFLVAFSEYHTAETYDINLLELNVSYAYLLTYAEYRNGMLRCEDAIVKHFVQSFHSVAVEESYEDTYPEQDAEWVDMLNTIVDRDGTSLLVADGKPLSETASTYVANIVGVQGMLSDDIMPFATKLGYSIASEMINHGNIPIYLDIALGYQHGESIEVQGCSVFNAVVILDDGPKYGESFARAMPTSLGTNLNIGRGLTTPQFYTDVPLMPFN